TVELLSISATGEFLDRWGLGNGRDWFEIYLDPTKIDCKCDADALRNYLAEDPSRLEDPSIRAPYRWRMSTQPGQSWDGTPVCALRFRHALTPDGSLKLTVCDIVPNSGHVEFVRTTLDNYYDDGRGGICNILRATNEYFTSDCRIIDAQCQQE